MTLWAFVSDIHGNRGALARAEALARNRDVDRFVCLGDVIGRGDPDACVRWACDQATLALLGNRDLDHLDWVSPALQSVVLSWLREARASDFAVTHGDRRFHRVLHSGATADGFRRVSCLMADEGLRLWFFGHTHQARVWCLDAQPSRERAGLLLLPTSTAPWPKRPSPAGSTFRLARQSPSMGEGEGGPERSPRRVILEPGRRYVVNVGTTGMPLPGRGGPSITLYDDAAGWVEMVPLGLT